MQSSIAQSAGAAEYISVEGSNFLDECSEYDTNDALGNAEYPFIAIAPWSILAQNSSTW